MAEKPLADCPDSGQVRKRPRLEDEEQELKVAGFSLSAIEEMRRTRDNELQNEPMDQQLRQFQVLDEVGSGSDEDDESGESETKLGYSLRSSRSQAVQLPPFVSQCRRSSYLKIFGAYHCANTGG